MVHADSSARGRCRAQAAVRQVWSSLILLVGVCPAAYAQAVPTSYGLFPSPTPNSNLTATEEAVRRPVRVTYRSTAGLPSLRTTREAVSRAPRHQQRPSELRALYARLTVNDGDDFVNVEPLGTDVRVRAVRVSAANEWCPGWVVQAVEKIVPRTTVQAVTGVRVCAISKQRVDTALKRAPDHYGYVDFVGSIDAVVADCDGVKRAFVFKMPPLIDRTVLRRRAPDVSALWDIGRRMRSLAGDRGASNPFEDSTPEGRSARETLGTSMVPDLLMGVYAGYLKQRLTAYIGPPIQREPSWVEVVERTSLSLATYVEPVMPPIAISARVFGDVRLRITADPVTGSVTAVEPLGPSLPFLGPSAAAAIRDWRFAPETAPIGPVDVTVRFRLRCP
jgi:hypothetical protein